MSFTTRIRIYRLHTRNNVYIHIYIYIYIYLMVWKFVCVEVSLRGFSKTFQKIQRIREKNEQQVDTTLSTEEACEEHMKKLMLYYYFLSVCTFFRGRH